jgi:hypothetical protein
MWAHYRRQFSRLEGLYGVSLTLDPKAGIEPGNSVPVLRKEVWPKFYEKLRYECGTKRDIDWAYFMVVDQVKGKLAHLHGVLSTPALEPEDIHTLWYRSHGGISDSIKRIQTPEHLDRTIGYALRAHFDDVRRRKEGDAPLFRPFCSHDIAFRNEESRSKRRKAVQAEKGRPTFRSEEACQEWLNRRLVDLEGSEVYVAGEGDGKLIQHVPGNGSKVELDHEQVEWFELLEVYPSRDEIPILEEYECDVSYSAPTHSEGGSSRNSMASVPEINPSKRSTSFTDDDGIQHRWDPDTRRVERKPVRNSR